MPLGMEVGLGPRDFVLDGDAAPSPKRGPSPPPIFGPCLLWPNGWIYQDGKKKAHVNISYHIISSVRTELFNAVVPNQWEFLDVELGPQVSRLC